MRNNRTNIFGLTFLVTLIVSGCIPRQPDAQIIRESEPCQGKECTDGDRKIKAGVSLEEFQRTLITLGYNYQGVGDGIGKDGRKSVSFLSFKKGKQFILLTQDSSVNDIWSIKFSDKDWNE